MYQNRSNSYSKKQNTRSSNINNLTNDLMSKISDLQEPKNPLRPPSSQNRSKNHFFSQYEDLEIVQLNRPQKGNAKKEPTSILEKAKMITLSKKSQIQRARNLYKKSNPEGDGMFLTGCGLYRAQTPQNETTEQYEEVDMNDALKYLVSHEKDDLQQLRRMIKKTSVHIQQYSHEVNRTKNQVVNAADVFGTQLNTDLRMKIYKHKPVENNFCQFHQTVPKRRISTSAKQRPKNIY